MSELKEEKRKVEIIFFDSYWTCDYVKNNPHCLFVFGDNDVQKGHGGQAVIRDLPNAIGIPTKKFPRNWSKDFYRDDDLESNKTKIDIAIGNILMTLSKCKEYTSLVLPKDGLGTGMASLKEKAPKTYDYLNTAIVNMCKELM